MVAKSFGRNLKFFRNFFRLKQTELAANSGINYRHYQDIEASKVDVKYSTALDIAKALSVPPCYLYQEYLNKNLSEASFFCESELLDQLPVGLCIFGFDGKIQYTNSHFRRHLTYFSKSELHEHLYVWDLLAGDEEIKLQAKERLGHVKTNSPTPQFARWTYLGPQKRPIDVLISWNYIKDSRQKVTHYCAVIFEAPK